MSADRVKVMEAMQSVVRAHEVLAEFHREIAAFYGILDEQLGDSSEVCFAATYPDYVAWEKGEKLKAPEHWLPTWMGRFYYKMTDEIEGSGDAARGFELGFVWIVARDPDLPELKEPEVWFGVASSGVKCRFKNHWDFGRYGVWNYLETTNVPANGWAKGEFPERFNFGRSGIYYVQRVPLSKLLDAALIRELVTEPLRAKFVEVFG